MKTRKTTSIPTSIADHGAWLLRLCFLLGLATFFGRVPDAFAQLEKGQVVTFVLHGRSLEANTTGDSADRKIQVYRPSQDTPTRWNDTRLIDLVDDLRRTPGDEWTVEASGTCKG